MSAVPSIRVRELNDAPPRADGDYVLYWMTANRRPWWNFSLDRAIELSRELGTPLLVFEALRCGYQWCSDRIHRFVLQGMVDNRHSFSTTSARYYAYVEPEPNHGRGLLEELAKRAAAIVTDDFPCFFLPQMAARVAQRLQVRMESVDSNGLLPMRAADKVFVRAHDFRRWLQRNLPPHLSEWPKSSPLMRFEIQPAVVPPRILERWPEATGKTLEGTPGQLAERPIDHSVGPAAFDGGTKAARRTLDQFFQERLSRYVDDRNRLDNGAASGLSPYLHFGHVSTHEIFDRLLRREEWSDAKLSSKTNGSREGWWGMSREAESFLDEVVTWRELGYNMCSKRDDYDQYDSLPAWAQRTLAEHADDPREHLYGLSEFESGVTHDRLWNSAQTQLVQDGRMHNYLRMLWGKKILEWSVKPQDALAIMIHLNNKYAVDGRNPNSYSGIFWVLGRYDRAWGPERPIFGKIRYMSSENTARKLKVQQYVERYTQPEGRQTKLW